MLRSSVWRAVASAAAGLCLAAAGVHAADGATAVASVKLKDGADAGTVTLMEATGSVLLKFDLKGFAPGFHAVHIHEKGACDGDFSSAGAIYNPLGAEHGLLSENGPMAGDLPNVNAAADGTIVAELLSPYLNLSKEAEDGLFDADGAAVVLFDGPDDHLTDPDTGGKARIACGVISVK